MKSCLIFDLDGTISDPKEGITKSINYALQENGFEQRPEDDLATYIGPPLDETFQILCCSSDFTLIEKLVRSYRERYAETGYRENVLYSNIAETIQNLYDNNIPLGVCTSKPERFARPILDMFQLSHFFQFVSGGDVGIKKSQQLSQLLSEGTINRQSIMIGDRNVDLSAARINGLKSAAVLWGHGSREELEAEQPDFILKEVHELRNLIL